MYRKLGRTVAAAFIAAIASAAFASPASAGLLTQSADNCDDGALTQPFKRWGDYANYKLVGGGSFENGATGWTLSGGAKVVSGNESYKVGGSTHKGYDRDHGEDQQCFHRVTPCAPPCGYFVTVE